MVEDHKKYLNKELRYDCPIDQLSEPAQEILNKYGSWMFALTSKIIKPYTPQQEHLIAVHEGKVRPINIYEESWYEYRRHSLYLEARKREKEISGGTGCSYESLVERFYKLACMGHEEARDWLVQEGVEYKKIYDGLFSLSNPPTNEFTSTNEGGKSFASGYGSGDSSIEADWSQSFDDMDSSEWECMLGGPDVDC